MFWVTRSVVLLIITRFSVILSVYFSVRSYHWKWKLRVWKSFKCLAWKRASVSANYDAENIAIYRKTLYLFRRYNAIRYIDIKKNDISIYQVITTCGPQCTTETNGENREGLLHPSTTSIHTRSTLGLHLGNLSHYSDCAWASGEIEWLGAEPPLWFRPSARIRAHTVRNWVCPILLRVRWSQ